MIERPSPYTEPEPKMPEPRQIQMGQSRQSHTKPVGVFARWLLPSLGSLSLLLILFVLINNSRRFLLDSDTGWHIRTGELILRERSVPRRDPFSHTMDGREWFAWEWLTDLGMAGMHRWRGLAGVVAGAFLVLLAGFAALYQMMIRRGADALVACGVTLFGALATIVHWLARPHLVSIAMMVLWYWVVEAYRRERTQWVWIAPLVVAVWANLHGAFVITFVVLAIYAAGEWLESAFRGRWWGADIRRVLFSYAGVAAISAAATLATPYGFRLYGHLWCYLTDSTLLASINEFRSPDFHLPDGKLIEILLLLGVVAAVNAIRQRRFVETGLMLLWGHLTLQSERHVTLAVVMLAPVIAEQWSYLLSELGDRIAGLTSGGAKVFRAVRDWYRGTMAINAELNGVFVLIAVAAFVIAAAALPWGGKILSPRFDPKRHPVEAADFVLQSPPPGLLFAHDQFGGYLIYRLFPKIKVFVDGRSDFYRQGDVLEQAETLVLARPQWQETLRNAGVTWMVLPTESPLAVIAKLSGKWATVHQDKTAEILVLKTMPPQLRQ